MINGDGHVENARLANRLAHIQRLQDRETLGVSLQQVGDPVQRVRPFRHRGRPPARKRTLRRLDRAIDISGCSTRNTSQHLTRRGIDTLDRLPDSASTHWLSMNIP
ncbi:hypothetical protein NIIDMKKI_67280 [Mycobacterium kansasii]|uniref:Uncharacterized protein n=1 Tax=Mycobacterium kansasii TaxID=1768 RepID=A0A7G1IN58_MYCKA|nr:hypothetical protein NIIDMKKI_67280 [Mycobacterium kansasii]